MSDLRDLLEKSDQLIDSSEAEEYLHKNLESIHEQSKKLNLKVSRSQQAEVTKGDYFLANKAFDVSQFRRVLNSINIKPTFEPLEPLGETDIEGFLKHEHNMIILTAIEESKKLTSNSFYKNYEQYVDEDWNEAKNELTKLLDKGGFYGDLAPSEKYNITNYKPNYGVSAGLSQAPHTPGRRGRTAMDTRMIGYSSVVFEFNQKRKKNDIFPIIQRFMECADEVDDKLARKREVIECWKILKCIIQEEHIEQQGVDTEKKSKILMKKRAKQYLENQYREYIEEMVSRFTNKPAREVNPEKLIDNYIDLLFKKNYPSELEIHNNYPIWARIFFSLRCGLVSTATKIAKDAGSIIPQNLIDFLSKPNPHPDLEDELRKECSRGGKEKVDYFKQAVYLILARSGTDVNLSKVFSKSEDYMWQKLSMIREKEFEISLSQLQETVRQHRKQFSERGRQSLLYFKLLLLSLQFEEAIEYLCSRDIDGYQVEAVHFAIALYHYKLINLPSNDSMPIFGEEKGKPYLNIYVLIRNYVRLFAHTDQRDAVSYFYLIRKQDILIKYMKDLVVEAKDFNVLLGSIDRDGRRRKGCMEEFLSSEKIMSVLGVAADLHEKNGRYDSAIQLYFMAEEYQRHSDEKISKSSEFLRRIIVIINKELSQVLADGNNRKEIIDLARTIETKFRKEKLKFRMKSDDKKQYDTFQTLLNLTVFFDLSHQQKYTEALSYIEQLNLLPLHPNSIENSRQNFKHLDDAIKRKFADIIFVTMHILFSLFKIEKKKEVLQSEQLLKDIRLKSATLLTFAGFIQNFMPSNTYSQLIRMDVMIR